MSEKPVRVQGKQGEVHRLPPDQLMDAVREQGERAPVRERELRKEARKDRESEDAGRKTADRAEPAPHRTPTKRRT